MGTVYANRALTWVLYMPTVHGHGYCTCQPCTDMGTVHANRALPWVLYMLTMH